MDDFFGLLSHSHVTHLNFFKIFKFQISDNFTDNFTIKTRLIRDGLGKKNFLSEC